MGDIANKWGEALDRLKEAYRLPPLEAFSLGLQVETIGLLEGLREDLDYAGKSKAGMTNRRRKPKAQAEAEVPPPAKRTRQKRGKLAITS